MGGVGKGTTRQITGIVLGRHGRDARHRKVLYVVVQIRRKGNAECIYYVFIKCKGSDHYHI
jgi:hypothetical protein